MCLIWLFSAYVSVIMAVNAWCGDLLECANYDPVPPTSALMVSVRVTSLLASGIRPFLETHVSFTCVSKILFSSPDPKGHVSYCHHLASVVRRPSVNFFIF